MKSIHIVEENLPAAWEKAVLECWEKGERFPTEYDKDGDSNSRDVTALIHITNPMAEPRIHRAFPGGLEDLEKYRNEIVMGVHDHWIDPVAGKWQYSYYERLKRYSVPQRDVPDDLVINQIHKAIESLKECPHTRRAQAVTWKAWKDIGEEHPTCMQRVWLRIEEETCKTCRGTCEIPHGSCFACEGLGSIKKLNMNVHFRSNDAYKAGFMNMYALIELQAEIAARLGVQVGEYMHIADSFHIYGSYFDEFQGFINLTKSRKFEDRVWDSSFATGFFIDACDILMNEDDMPTIMKFKILGRKNQLEGKW